MSAGSDLDGNNGNSAQDRQAYVLALFSEMNEHVRSTENKYATVSVSYLSLVTFLSSLSPAGQQSATGYVLMVLVGCTVIVLQRWYRIWKEHYLQVCKCLYKDVDIAEEMKPFWLRDNRRKSTLNADDALYYFTNMVNLYVVIRLCSSLIAQGESVFAKFLIPGLLFVAYILFLIFIRINISRQRYLKA